MALLSVIRSGHGSPVALVRAALMDLGFAGLIEKIEERFGTFVTSALLLALVLLVFAWIIEIIFSLYISGTSLWEENGESASLGLAKIILVHIILAFITSVVGYTIIRRIRNRAIRQAKQQLVDIAIKAKEEAIGEIKKLGFEQGREIEQLGVEHVRRVHSAALMYGVDLKIR